MSLSKMKPNNQNGIFRSVKFGWNYWSEGYDGLGNQFYWCKKPEYREKTIEHDLATENLYHLRLLAECTLFVIYKAVYLTSLALVTIISFMNLYATHRNRFLLS
jgi:hypothetical protein